MRNLLWFLLGVIGGFVAAHLMNKDPRGHEVLADVDARITEFTDRIGDAYGTAKSTADDAVDAVKSTAGDVVENAADAASDAAESAKTAAKKLAD